MTYCAGTSSSDATATSSRRRPTSFESWPGSLGARRPAFCRELGTMTATRLLSWGTCWNKESRR